MSVLEVNFNSSVAELEVRVETLEGTAADHETRISAAESDIDGNGFPSFGENQFLIWEAELLSK